jgi:general secretion pathway protein F
MPAYDYLALTASGARQRGVTEADTEQQARQRLRDQGLVPLSVESSRRSAGAGSGAGFRRSARLGGDQVVLFTRLLGTLVEFRPAAR